MFEEAALFLDDVYEWRDPAGAVFHQVRHRARRAEEQSSCLHPKDGVGGARIAGASRFRWQLHLVSNRLPTFSNNVWWQDGHPTICWQELCQRKS